MLVITRNVILMPEIVASAQQSQGILAMPTNLQMIRAIASACTSLVIGITTHAQAAIATQTKTVIQQ